MRKLFISLTLLAVIGAGVAGWKIYSKQTSGKLSAPQLVKVTRGPINETVEVTGEVSPLNRVEVKPPISGRVEKLLVDEGSKVKAGDILAWMSSSDRAAILDAARAQGTKEFRYWEDAYKATPIVAPLSGVVILRDVVVGQTVDPSTVLFAMSDKLIVVAQVDESDLGRVQPGMAARLTLDAYPDHVIDGHVFQILHEGKNVSNVITYGVKIEPKEIPAFFRSQMTANVSLIVREEKEALLVPSAAVRNDNGSKKVYVPGKDKKPAERSIETGLDNGQLTQVLSGLDEGDTVILSRKRYSPQKGAQNSPLAFGGRNTSNSGGSRSGGTRQSGSRP